MRSVLAVWKMRSVFAVWGIVEYGSPSLLKVFSTVEAAQVLLTKLVEHLKEKPAEFDWSVESESDDERDARWTAYCAAVEAWSARCPADLGVCMWDSYQIQELEVEEGAP